MAKAVSNEELQLRKRARRRLVGAVALVVVVVVFLPMVLDGEPKPLSQDIAINIPSPPGEEDDVDAASSEPQPLQFRPIEPSTDNAGSAQSDSAAQSGVANDEPVSSSGPDSEGKPGELSKTTPRAVAAAEDGFAVQLGAFSDADNALRLAKTVSDARFTAYTEEVTTAGGKRTRVRVGPYPTRAAAEEASQRLKARRLTYGNPVIVKVTD